MKKFLIVIILALTSIQAVADCHLKGKTYPTGTEKGQMRCGADGLWHPK